MLVSPVSGRCSPGGICGGSRSHGRKWDILAGAMLREDSARFTDIYRLLLRAARAEVIDRDRLPDFLDLEDGGGFALLAPGRAGRWTHG